MQKERLTRVCVDIEISVWPAAEYLAVVRDISLSGCLLVTAARLKQAQQVPLAFPVGGGGELRLTGTVVRWHDDREGGGYGVRFEPMAEEERRALELLMGGGGERPASAAMTHPQ